MISLPQALREVGRFGSRTWLAAAFPLQDGQLFRLRKEQTNLSFNRLKSKIPFSWF